MKKVTTLSLKLNLFITVLCICFSQASRAQAAISPAPDTAIAAQNQPFQYVKIEVGMHILDCPVLPPQLKEKLMTLTGIKDYQVNKTSETILFSIPEGIITKEQIVNLAVRCGFPMSAVNVITQSKPFTN